MKLRGLKVQGFKSFADSTEIEFHDGITAVVGPNGCGKSNISDAIRWVLGEQRPTAIRGAKMEEAIFQGSVNRRPVNRGSVAMIVSNEDGQLPVPFSEVEIGRTVYRDGGSEYSLNRTGCRLKDVIDLCRDTGLGANAYSVIENRMIDAILSDRTDERRGLFEEAAGIGRYKDRRRGALRRLDRAEADLQRLNDVIAEIETKVRSLARQRGKAERYKKLRDRRLSVEVEVVRHQLEAFGRRLTEVVTELDRGEHQGDGMAAELTAAEASFEEVRLRQIDVEKARSEAAGKLEAVREELVRWERELAVAEERSGYAQRRLGQIDVDRTDARALIERMDSDEEESAEQLRTVEQDLSEARVEQQDRQERTAEVRVRLGAARTELEQIESEERELTRKVAQLEIDGAGAEAQAEELERRSMQIEADLEAAQDNLSEIENQGDLFSDRLQVLADDAQDGADRLKGAQEALVEAKRVLEAARDVERAAHERSSSLQAQWSTLESLDRDQAGIEPVLSAASGLNLDGVVGILSDFVSAPGDLAHAVDAYLGPLTRSIVVRDTKAARRLINWFSDDWGEGGGLILLPLDRVPTDAPTSGSLLDAIHVHGEGAPWLKALLGGVNLVDDSDLLESSDGFRLSTSGASVDRSGIVRVGNPTGVSGVLERKERVKSAAAAAEEAGQQAEAALSARQEAEETSQAAEEAVEQLRKVLSEREKALHDAEVEAAARIDREDRLRHQREELNRQLEVTVSSRSRALERAKTSVEGRAGLSDFEDSLRARRHVARASLATVEEEWEAVRVEESGLSIQVARLEGEVERVTGRIQDATQARERARQRMVSLDEEDLGLREEMAQAAELKATGEETLQGLFQQRDQARQELAERDQAVEALLERLSEADRRVREARTAERGATDRRHQFELEQQELEGKLNRIRDRLEGEWGKPLETLLHDAEPIEGDPEDLAEELDEILDQLARIGPVNMLAVEEHAEESERLDFLQVQCHDLVEARDGLKTAIRQINESATSLFTETFDSIRENFRETFHRLFQGGEADLWLADPDDPLESPIEIHASPKGKKTQRIDLLSGGERALTALSLLFGIYLVKPSPFCVLDEVDAPLDESNIGRFIRLLQDFKGQTQFVVITHNPRTIEAADWIYGVTMEEPGVSTIVGVRLEEALETAGISA